MKHIIWDWNGTLFHDIDAVVGATNEVFKPYGVAAFDNDGFRAAYTRPIWVAYERILGRTLREGEWEVLDQSFHDHYHRLMLSCALAEEAVDCLRTWAESGRTQSLLSMWAHERLVLKAAELGIAEYFARIDGLSDGGAPGGGKAEHMVAHIESLDVRPSEILVIGDSIDDAHAAQHVGAQPVLYAGGMTSHADLAASGFPVVDSLSKAFDFAG
ncbi:HAD family hydrolase [Sphaerisporangium corydalis]|uniref:HAD family hydrolase n=1 Tax=Sphaerisporangium corydalis TaxID=1441875 RepID=A0ABV9EA75_9ACTN|nr:HAD family hydrolase [Sphaerisporangium corydalis]